MSQNTAGALTALDPVEAWRPWKPDDANPWDLKRAGHLYRRLAFSPSWDELRLALKDGFETTLVRLLAGGPGQEDFEADVDYAVRGLSENSQYDTLAEYQEFWLYRMLNSPHPLRERMTLFWHNHFATSAAKVRRPALMQQQNALFRRHALGRFRPLLLEVSRDPAMLIWLDSNSNRKGQPNENYAREFLELFSLGVGHYSEKDVQGAARAFTGWHTADGKFIDNKRQHDDGVKTVLGRTGNWDGADLVRIALERPACARFLVRKLYRHFISENGAAPERLLEPLAEQLRKSDYDIGGVVRTMARSRLFFSEHAYRQRIKSPSEFLVGLLRSLQGGKVKLTSLRNTLDDLGQSLYAPPTVKGWDGGKAWLNSATLLARHNLAWALVGGDDPRFRQALDPAALVQKLGGPDSARQTDFLFDLLLQGDVARASRQKVLDDLKAGIPKNADLAHRLRETTHTILLMPEYQLG